MTSRRSPTSTTSPDTFDGIATEELATRLSAVAASDPASEHVRRALRAELETELVRSRQDPLAALQTRWARRLTSAVRRAERAEHRLARTEQRRWFRLGKNGSAFLRRPTGETLSALLDAFRRHPLPAAPEPEKVPIDPLRPHHTSRRPPPYIHLRVAHAGRIETFAALTTSVDIDGASDVDPADFDLLLLEPGADDRLGRVPIEIVDRFVESRTPSVLWARTADHLLLEHAKQVDLVLTEDPSLAGDATSPTLVLDPSFDPGVYNPVGWRREPEGDLLDLVAHRDLWGESFLRQVQAHRAVVTEDAALSLVAAAAGTPVVAARSAGFDRLLGDFYLPASNPEELAAAAEAMRDPDERERLSVGARRHALTYHTHRVRLEELLDHLDIPLVEAPRVSVLVATKRPERMDAVIANVAKQNWPRLEILLLLHGPDRFDRTALEEALSSVDLPSVVVECPPEWTLGDCLNAGLDRASGEYVAKMDDDDDYGPHHLGDLLTALEYADAAAVGKLSNVTYLTSRDLTVDWRLDDQEGFVHHLPGATMMMRREIALRYRFNRVAHGVDSALWERMRGDGLKLYSTHRMNFVRHRHNDHTYQRDNDDFLRLAKAAPRKGLDTGLWFV